MLNVYLILLVAAIVLPISISPYLRRKAFHDSSNKIFGIVKECNYPKKSDLDVPVIDVVYCTTFHNLGHVLSIAFIIIVFPMTVGKFLCGTFATYDLYMVMLAVTVYLLFLFGAKNMLFSQLVITQNYLHFVGPYSFKKWDAASRSDIEVAFYITQGSGILWIKIHNHFPMLFFGVSNGSEICKVILSKGA